MYSTTIDQAMYMTSEIMWEKASQMWKRNKKSFTEYLEVILQGLYVMNLNYSFYLPVSSKAN